MHALDVTAEQQARHDELLRSLSQTQRFALIAGLWASGRRLAELGVRARHEGASEPLIRWLLTSIIYDDATAVRLHGARPPS